MFGYPEWNWKTSRESWKWRKEKPSERKDFSLVWRRGSVFFDFDEDGAIVVFSSRITVSMMWDKATMPQEFFFSADESECGWKLKESDVL